MAFIFWRYRLWRVMTKKTSSPTHAARALVPVFAIVIVGALRFASQTPTRAAESNAPRPALRIVATRAPAPTSAPAVVEPTAVQAVAAAAAVPTVEPVAATAAPALAAAPTVAPPAQPAPAQKLPSKALIEGIVHQQQTWNNCGPANLSMALQFLGRTETQRDTAKFLKPVRDDKNVSPNEMVAYAQSLGFRARWISGGDLQLIRAFVAAGIPVIAESWFIPEPNDEMGHYELIHGYDGADLIADDSYKGPNQRFNADAWDKLWKVFNRSLVVVWRADQDAQVKAILGERWDEARMHALALEIARREVELDPSDKYAWFNLGTNLLVTGDPAAATTAFDKADALKLPWRMLWYQHGPYEANLLAGNNAQVLTLTNRSLKGTGDLEESYYWRARAYAAMGKKSEARRDFATALKLNPRYDAAKRALEGK
jgi:tetratricopeptide (TPR) repeat protein